MGTVKFEKEQLLLYAVTNRVHAVKETLYSQVRDALEGGVTCVQLREKYMKEEDFTAEAVKLKALCKNYSVPLIINDNLNVALRSGADGIHVGQEDMSAEEIRKLAGREFIIGVTAKMAEAAGADYIGVGAVFPSPTKQGAIRITRQELKDICEAVSIPSVAIGGVNIENMKQLKGMGMDGFAVVSALFAAEDIQSAARSLISEARAVVY